MSEEREFNPWQWDRDNARAGQARLTIEHQGHQVSLDHRGVSIDGQRIVRDDLLKAKTDHGFEVRPDGTVMYRAKEVAFISKQDGQVTVWGEDGPGHQERQHQAEAATQRAVESAQMAVSLETEQREREQEEQRRRREREDRALAEPHRKDPERHEPTRELEISL
ncbi:hypothetical protein [Actinacidiphila glaucinigra]|uniref:hypothetical protein n=1 Tax=Actinacidiphila glaucinigra TaxID=235986 RepID=UPI00371E4ABA